MALKCGAKWLFSDFVFSDSCAGFKHRGDHYVRITFRCVSLS